MLDRHLPEHMVALVQTVCYLNKVINLSNTLMTISTFFFVKVTILHVFVESLEIFHFL